MKNIIFIYSLLILLVSGCSQEESIFSSSTNSVKFTATFEQNESRTYIEEGKYLRWTKGDQISLFDGNTLNQKFQFDGATGDNSGTFSLLTSSYGTGNDLSANYAVYPYDKSISISEEGVITTTLPDEQTYEYNSFGLGANTMIAVTQNTEDKFLAFKNIGGYLKLQLYGTNTQIKQIKFAGNESERIAGEAEITISNTGEPIIKMTKEAEKTIILNCENKGVKIGNSADNATSFWIVLPPTTFTNGFTVTIITSEGEEIVKSTDNEITIERNTIKPMSAFEIVSKIEPNYQWYINSVGNEYYIQKPEELYALSKLSNGDPNALAIVGEEGAITFEGKTINLKCNIDLEECCNPKCGSWEPIGNFMGIFRGNSYTINNLYCNRNPEMGLFAKLTNAAIYDLTIEGDMQRRIEEWDGYPTIGGFAVNASNSIFKNCTSNVHIKTISGSQCPISLTAGGICGFANECIFIACKSSSNISDTQTEFYYNHFIGGIVGRAFNSKIIACTKLSGELIQTNHQAYCYVGGILGQMPSSDLTQIRSCYSSIKLEGRQPGQILGSYGQDKGKPNIQSCFYSGPYYRGVGTKFYGGSEYSYDYGTQESENLSSEIEIMNATITQWNIDNPEYTCEYLYVLDDNNLTLKLNTASLQ